MRHWKKNMEPVSFEKLSGFLVEDYEGNIQPMSEPYFKATELAPGTWQVLSDGDYTYVLEGEDEAICIDSGSGAGNIREFCQTLTDKPIYRILNTHCHFDHTAQNYLFDAVYMSPKSYPGRCRPFAILNAIEDWCDDYPVVFINGGEIFPLKGRPLEILNEENHAVGSLQFLDRQSRILFIGDEVHGNFLDCYGPVEHVAGILRRFKALRPYYDRIAAGCGVWDAVYIDKYLEILEYILDGHEHEGEEDFIPFEDVYASVEEIDGKPVIHRRCPPAYALKQRLIKTEIGRKLIEQNHGRAAVGMGRRLSPDGPWDRRMVKDGFIVNYYLNKIWGKFDPSTR